MSFLSSFWSIFKTNKPVTPEEHNPLRIKLGSIIGMGDQFRLLTAGSSEVRGIAAESPVEGKGVIDLGDGYRLHRFYTNDVDVMLQVRTSGYDDNHVEEVILFNYLGCQTVNTEQELQRLAGASSPIGLPTYQHNDKTFNRVWGSEPGQTDLIRMIEKVKNPDAAYDVQHLSMLYSRETDLSERTEFLLFSVEETREPNGERTVQISTCVGLTVFANDINVI